jgi:hypothetical protein
VRAWWVSSSVVLSMLASGCWDSHGLGADARLDAPSLRDDAFAPSTSLVWVLVHPVDAPPSGAGLILFDEVSQSIVRRLPLPDPDASVHGLAWDGRSLWLSSAGSVTLGLDRGAGLLQLDPTDGRVIQRFDRIRAEGVAADGDTIWYAGARPDEAGPTLVHLAQNGLQLSFVPIPEPALIQDLAIADGALYYLVNDDQDRIMRIDPSTGSATRVASGVYEAPYALAFDGAHLAVALADRFTSEPRIRRFDPATGALVRESPFRVQGWVTAIAFVR